MRGQGRAGAWRIEIMLEVDLPTVVGGGPGSGSGQVRVGVVAAEIVQGGVEDG